MPQRTRLPFRVIAIVEEIATLSSFVASAARTSDKFLAIMLRDAKHSRAQVEELSSVAIAAQLDKRFTLISNTHVVEGVQYIHFPSTMLSLPKPKTSVAGREGRYGFSAHTAGDIRAASQRGGAWVTLSPIFPTRSKPGVSAIGVAVLAPIPTIDIPIFALGGITSIERAATVIAAGAHGFAAISIFRQRSPSDIRSLLDNILTLFPHSAV